MDAFIAWLLTTLALPGVGLPAIFLISFISATLLPLGSEPAVFGYLKLNPDMFWLAIVVATVGNTLGGVVDWWMGKEARLGVEKYRQTHHKPALEGRWLGWLARFGPAFLLLSWLPVVGDPLCAVAGWLRMPFWACTFYMAVGKFLRYLSATALLLWVPDSVWQGLWAPFRALFGG